MNRCYEVFKEKLHKNKEWEQFKPMLDWFVRYLEGIKFDKVALNGCFDIGSFNISFKLPDGVILSINKRLEDMDNNFVGFNLVDNRELLISDINTITNVRDYIIAVQKGHFY